jgi:exopolysaccharide production protein ExoZ
MELGRAAGLDHRPGPVLQIQYLRGVAALLVVFHHVRTPVAALYSPLGKFEAAMNGVDVFFVISGFIMCTASRSEPAGEFVRRRLIRVVPLYWVFTLLFVLLVPGFTGMPKDPPIQDILRSLLFIPFNNPAYFDRVWPLLIPGWTLNYEMFFYAVFALGLLIRKPLTIVCLTIPALAALGLAIHFTDPALKTYTDFKLLEFTAGVLLGLAFQRFSFKGLASLLPVGLVPLLLINPFRDWAPPALLAASTLLVAGALSLESSFKRPIGTLKLLGDASYSIYLSHLLVLSLGYHLLPRLPLTGWPQFIAFAVFVLAGSAAFGVATYYFLERPLTRLLSRLTRLIADALKPKGRTAALPNSAR